MEVAGLWDLDSCQLIQRKFKQILKLCLRTDWPAFSKMQSKLKQIIFCFLFRGVCDLCDTHHTVCTVCVKTTYCLAYIMQCLFTVTFSKYTVTGINCVTLSVLEVGIAIKIWWSSVISHKLRYNITMVLQYALVYLILLFSFFFCANQSLKVKLFQHLF